MRHIELSCRVLQFLNATEPHSVSIDLDNATLLDRLPSDQLQVKLEFAIDDNTPMSTVPTLPEPNPGVSETALDFQIDLAERLASSIDPCDESTWPLVQGSRRYCTKDELMAAARSISAGNFGARIGLISDTHLFTRPDCIYQYKASDKHSSLGTWRKIEEMLPRFESEPCAVAVTQTARELSKAFHCEIGKKEELAHLLSELSKVTGPYFVCKTHSTNQATMLEREICCTEDQLQRARSICEGIQLQRLAHEVFDFVLVPRHTDSEEHRGSGILDWFRRVTKLGSSREDDG